ncbi:DUF1080 domain-containing protein [Fulvivirgaceae bacterium BMA10]|uniref:DUF1080 domain-containing protein n=1 Tax=Splendidivirga corallicola TaxID=3051826 RepID=A0ABT8KNG2_9BACT|nr:DUF1080 domain-containing protein [Fulvivirgaceae bacterium BMA10]
MKRITIYFILSLIVSFSALSQDRRTVETKVADILAQMPTKDIQHRDRLMREMADLGDNGLQLFTNRVLTPGTGDDTAVRFALNGLARYASEFDHEKERASTEDAFLQALNSADNDEVKAFFIHQLKLIGGDKSVKAVSQYLHDDRLGPAATQLIATVASSESKKQLLNALSNAKGIHQITIVKALGDLKVKAASDAIAKLAGSQNPDLQRVTLYSLANIADPGISATLLKAAKEANYNYESNNAVGALVLFADRLGEEGQLALSEKICRTIIKNSKSTAQLHNKATALSILSKYFGHEITKDLLKAIDNSNRPFRNGVLNIAEKQGGVADTRAWVKRSKELGPEIQADIIRMLGRRNDAVAIPYVETALNSQSKAVRKAAVRALTDLSGEDALQRLLTHLASISDKEELNHTEILLLTISDREHLKPFVTSLEKLPSSGKVVAINVIAAKSGSKYFDKIYHYTNDSNADVKKAAFSALKKLSGTQHVDKLMTLLYKVNDDGEIAEVQQALIHAVEDIESANERSKPFLAALNSKGSQDRIIKVLPQVGGSNALKAVSGLFDQGSGDVKSTAFEALVNWQDHHASNILYGICKKGSDDFKEKAFNGFVNQVASSRLPADQKLLQFRKIMPYASNDTQRIAVINSLGNVKTFLSFLYVSDYLDNTSLQQGASRSLMRIALPANGKKVGLYGKEVRKSLEKAANILSGPESEYMKIDIRNYLDAMPKDEGFVSMFNGKDLTGWKGLVGNPISRAKLSAKELAKKQEEADKKMHENWSVKDGEIVFSGHGANLCSTKDYGDFEMLVDWRISEGGDSGIYLRGSPQIQIWDTSRVEVGAQVGSGGLYNNQSNRSTPLKVTDNPINEWNTFRIKMVGEKVTVYSNGELVVDNVTLENYWDRKQPIFPTGAIELQAHGTDLAFRNIYVREIKSTEYNLSSEEKAEGFVALFNGSNLDGWQGNKTDYLVEGNEIVIRPKQGGHGNLYTEKEYGDFNFRFEFQLTPGANNGLGIRAPLEGDAAYLGMELQILDNTAAIYSNLKDYQYHGSVYGVIPAKRGYLKPVGQWNSEEVIVQGSRVKVILNGTVIVDGDIKEASKNGTMDHSDHPGLKRDKGYIGFLGHGSVVKFRNIRIKDLSK